VGVGVSMGVGVDVKVSRVPLYLYPHPHLVDLMSEEKTLWRGMYVVVGVVVVVILEPHPQLCI